MSRPQDAENYCPGIPRNARVAWLRDDVAKQMGLETEEERRAFYAEQERLAGEEGRRWLEEKLAIVRGKSIDAIPGGSYCYDVSDDAELVDGEFDPTDEAYWTAHVPHVFCPYFRPTDHGITYCDFLEEGSVAPWDDEFEKALAHFGSIEELAKNDSGSILFDACSICGRVLDALRQEVRHSTD